MGISALVAVVIVALAAGLGSQYLSKGVPSYHWLIVAVAWAFGAYLASEAVVGSTIVAFVKDFGPQFDGLYIIPAIIGAIVVGFVADYGTRATYQLSPA